MDSTEDCILCQREKITNETLLLLDTCLESPLTMLQVNAKENQAKELVIHSPPSLKIIPTTIDEPTQFVDSANLSHLNIIVEPTNNMHQSPLIIFIKQNPEVTVPHTITESTEVSASNVTQSNTAIVSKQQDTYDVTDMETSAVEENDEALEIDEESSCDVEYFENPNKTYSCCDICRRMFQDKAALNQHIKLIHDTIQYCIYCNFTCTNRADIISHLSEEHLHHSYPCPYCHKILSSKHKFKYHQAHYHCDNFNCICKMCGKDLKHKISLSAHINEEHWDVNHNYYIRNDGYDDEPPSPSYPPDLSLAPEVCTVCTKLVCVCKRKPHDHVFQYYDRSLKHVCKICSKRFKTLEQLHFHLIKEHNELPFSCKLCDRKFKKRQSLEYHIKMRHTNVMPFPCQFCNKSFKLSDNLKMHLFNMHNNTIRQ